MKTKEELNALKEEYKSLQKKLSELTDDEISLVTGGIIKNERGSEILDWHAGSNQPDNRYQTTGQFTGIESESTNDLLDKRVSNTTMIRQKMKSSDS